MKKLMAFLLVAVMLLSVSPVYAWPGREHHERGYRYHDGHWWLGDEIVAGLVAGAILAELPPRCRIVSIGGIPYYYDGYYYYQSGPAGFVVVQPAVAPVFVAPAPVAVAPAMVPVAVAAPAAPAVAAPAQAPSAVASPSVMRDASITVKIKNRNGSATEVMLVRKGKGFVGPQGEYYDAMPTKEQLNALYGQ